VRGLSGVNGKSQGKKKDLHGFRTSREYNEQKYKDRGVG